MYVFIRIHTARKSNVVDTLIMTTESPIMIIDFLEISPSLELPEQ